MVGYYKKNTHKRLKAFWVFFCWFSFYPSEGAGLIVPTGSFKIGSQSSMNVYLMIPSLGMRKVAITIYTSDSGEESEFW